MCRLLKVHRSSYYKRKKNDICKTKLENNELLKMIRSIFDDNKGNYGSPRIHQVIVKSGTNVGKNRIARLMRKESIKSISKRKFKLPNTTDSNHNLPIAPNVLNQDFSVKIPGEVLISDITYIKINQNFVFLCAVMDLASRKIVGWSLMNHMETNLITTALERSYKMNRPNKNCIFHSDRGSQYASIEFRNLLSKHKVIQSMSRKGNCYDNACMESFFNTIKKELINKKEYILVLDILHQESMN
jgi:putative transposase